MTTRATELSGRSSWRESPSAERIVDLEGLATTDVVVGDDRGREPLVEGGGVVALAAAHPEAGGGRRPTAGLVHAAHGRPRRGPVDGGRRRWPSAGGPARGCTTRRWPRRPRSVVAGRARAPGRCRPRSGARPTSAATALSEQRHAQRRADVGAVAAVHVEVAVPAPAGPGSPAVTGERSRATAAPGWGRPRAAGRARRRAGRPGWPGRAGRSAPRSR